MQVPLLNEDPTEKVLHPYYNSIHMLDMEEQMVVSGGSTNESQEKCDRDKLPTMFSKWPQLLENDIRRKIKGRLKLVKTEVKKIMLGQNHCPEVLNGVTNV